MRPLTDEETKVFFTKLSDYIGPNIKYLIDRADEPHVFRLIKDRVYYMSEALMKISTNISRD
jgi:60S ribosome subunit biogenesis protein NIP7